MLQPIDTQSVFEETRTFSKKGKKSCRYLIGCAHKLDRNVTKSGKSWDTPYLWYWSLSNRIPVASINSFFLLHYHPRIDLWQIISAWQVCLLESYFKHNTVSLSNSSHVVPFDCSIILNLYIMAFTLTFILFSQYSRFTFLAYGIKLK